MWSMVCHGKVYKKAVSIFLIFSLTGCGNNYVLNLYSKPSGARVQIGPDIEGRTPCNVEIPKNSSLIKHHRIEIKYTLEDGREFTKTYDLRKYEPSSGLAEGGAAVFAGPGVFLLWIASSDEHEECRSFDEEVDEHSQRLLVGLAGLGLIGFGYLTYLALGGESSAKYEYDIYETFEEANDISVN